MANFAENVSLFLASVHIDKLKSNFYLFKLMEDGVVSVLMIKMSL